MHEVTLRILVTGGAGYLGSVLCDRLLESGHRVHVLDTLREGCGSMAYCCSHQNFRLTIGDARDPAALIPALSDADAIIPLAGIVGAPACDRVPQEAQEVNLEAIRLLAKHCSNQQRVVFPMTNSGYGSTAGAAECTEDTDLKPISLYGRTKVEAEAAIMSRRNAISLRLATVFGMSPNMRTDLLVNGYVWNALTAGAISVFDPEFRRNFVHIQDVAECFRYAVNSPSMTARVFNVGLPDANISKRQLAQLVATELPGTEVVEHKRQTDPDKRNYLVSHARLRDAGFVCGRALASGVREMAQGLRVLNFGRRRPW